MFNWLELWFLSHFEKTTAVNILWYETLNAQYLDIVLRKYAVSLLITALLKIVFIFQAIPLIWWHHLDPYPSTIWWHFSSSLGWRSNMSSYRAIVRNLSQPVLTHFGSRIWQVPFSHQFYIHLKIHGFPGVQLDFDGIPWVHLELNGFKGTFWTYANECPVLS